MTKTLRYWQDLIKKSFKIWYLNKILQELIKILILISILQDSYKILQDLNKISTWEDCTEHPSRKQIGCLRFVGRIQKRICDLRFMRILHYQKNGWSEKGSFTMTTACPRAPREKKKKTARTNWSSRRRQEEKAT